TANDTTLLVSPLAHGGGGGVASPSAAVDSSSLQSWAEHAPSSPWLQGGSTTVARPLASVTIVWVRLPRSPHPTSTVSDLAAPAPLTTKMPGPPSMAPLAIAS